MSKIWFITGATRGIGAEIVKAALAAGDTVVATGRDANKIAATFGLADGRLLALPLDVTQPHQVDTAIEAALAKFGRIDVLVNNAGYGQLGPFEEHNASAAEAQFATNVFGLFNVSRAVLPAMRKQRSGHIFNLSSIAGVRGGPGGALYSASKFAVEGFSESLAAEVAPFNIHVTIIEPGFFRTDFLDPSSVRYGNQGIADYAELSATISNNYQARNHTQAGDPARLAQVFVQLANEARPPLRFAAGTDAIEISEARLESRRAELAQWRALSASTDIVE